MRPRRAGMRGSGARRSAYLDDDDDDDDADCGCCCCDGPCTRARALRWGLGGCLLVVLAVNFVLVLVFSDGGGGAGSGGDGGPGLGLFARVAASAGFGPADPARRHGVFAGQLRSLHHPEWCAELPTAARLSGKKRSSRHSSSSSMTDDSAQGLQATAGPCAKDDLVQQLIAVAARDPLPVWLDDGGGGGGGDGNGDRGEGNARGGSGGGYFLRHIESLPSQGRQCLSAKLAADGDSSQLTVADCARVGAQWLFTKSKQVVLFDRAATPHELDFRDLNRAQHRRDGGSNADGDDDGDGDGDGAVGVDAGADGGGDDDGGRSSGGGGADEAAPPLQCLTLVLLGGGGSGGATAEGGSGAGGEPAAGRTSVTQTAFALGLAPCLPLGAVAVGRQQWDFQTTKGTKDLVHTRAFARFDFNEFQSREVGELRQPGWPNTRSSQCTAAVPAAQKASGVVALEPTSVIICFVNEEWFALWRTINAVIDLSPPALLREIVLVDDGSDAPEMGAELERAIQAHPAYHLLKLYRTGSRTGLIRARMFGADRAEASILTFLDSHVEVNEGWLEPLLLRVTEDATRVVAPVITVIDQNTLANQASTSVNNVAYGVLDWSLIFHWSYTSSRPAPQVRSARSAPTDAVEAPTMAGGLFSIDRDFFYSIGAYDDGMTGWGGENIEISFRIWTCGGSIEVAPCSVVGHIFRQRNPSPFPGANINVIFRRNLIRAAEVWMDDFKHIYYRRAVVRDQDRGRGDSSLERRVALRESLQCKSFQWYLDTVYPSLFAPRDEFVLYNGALFQSAARLGMGAEGAHFCLQVASKDPPVGSALALKACAGRPEEKFYFGAAGQLVPASWPGETLCATAASPGYVASRGGITLQVCTGHHRSTLAPEQRWHAVHLAAVAGAGASGGGGDGGSAGAAKPTSGRGMVALRNDATGLCLGVSTGGPLKALLGGPALSPCPADDSAAAALVPGGAEDAAGHVLWEMDKLWGTNGKGGAGGSGGGASRAKRGAGGVDSSAQVSALLPARARATPLQGPRAYKTLGSLDCLEDVAGNGIDGWPPGLPGANTDASLAQCRAACDATAQCNSFSFNPTIGDCWLKVRCGAPTQLCQSFEGYETHFATDGCDGGGGGGPGQKHGADKDHADQAVAKK